MMRILIAAVLLSLLINPVISQSAEPAQSPKLIYSSGASAPFATIINAVDLNGQQAILEASETAIWWAKISPDHTKIALFNASYQLVIRDGTGDMLAEYKFQKQDDLTWYLWGWQSDNRLVFSSEQSPDGKRTIIFYGLDFDASQITLTPLDELTQFIKQLNVEEYGNVYFNIIFNPTFEYAVTPINPAEPGILEDRLYVWKIASLQSPETILEGFAWYVEGHAPAWSHKGHELLFDRVENSMGTLYRFIKPDIEVQKVVGPACDGCVFPSFPAWSPHDDRVALWYPDENWSLITVDLKTGKKNTLLIANIWGWIYWSPDGTLLGFMSYNPSDTPSIKVIDSSTGKMVLEKVFSEPVAIVGWMY